MNIRNAMMWVLVFHVSLVAAKEGDPLPLKRPEWREECISAVGLCTVYLVNPFIIDGKYMSNLKPSIDIHWFGLSSASVMPPRIMETPPASTLKIPITDGTEFFSYSGLSDSWEIYGEAIVNAKAIAPYKAFRKVTGCWPFHIMDFADLPADKEVDFLMSESGEVVDTDLETPFCVNQLSRAFDKENPSSCVVHSRKGQFYVYGDSLYQLRFEVKGKMTEQEMASNTRFFVITGEGNNRTLEAVTAYNYTENVQLRTFPEGKCTKIESATPEWKAWDERSKEKIVYPPFPAALKEEYRKFNVTA